ncbi:hypothetical protein BDM02DRAFT_3185712 [Thelephora ganbajun]|uniref:Uncharacterized protein n=1 Tax=Thelephora ganbajun TaxID=370292 RepID=A0ACB6ZL42_THEGA|nr:hypothetical protein BDM02DRAFT_3185712 [Thelephora ganbajun]
MTVCGYKHVRARTSQATRDRNGCKQSFERSDWDQAGRKIILKSRRYTGAEWGWIGAKCLLRLWNHRAQEPSKEMRENAAREMTVGDVDGYLRWTHPAVTSRRSTTSFSLPPVRQGFPLRVLESANRYKFYEILKNDPLEYRRVYEEFRIEAALVVVNSSYLQRAVLLSITTMAP